MRLRKRDMPLVFLLGAAVALLPAIARSATTSEVEAVNEGLGGLYGEHHRWSPSQVSVVAGGVVTLSNHTAVAHGVEWRSAVMPTCSGGVPVGATPEHSGANWTGTCMFTKPGAYTFYCTVHGPEMTGTITVPGTPTAATQLPTEVTQTGATLSGSVDPEGDATSYYFEYGSGGLEQKIPFTAQGVGSDFSAHHVSASLKGLAPDTQYHVELFATYGAGSTVLGGEEVFSTPPVGAPSVTTGEATAVTQTGATLGGAASPEGLETTYHFEYGSGASYEHNTPSERTGPEGVNHVALAAVTALTPGTLYHFRLVAANESGPAHGEDRTFITSSLSPAGTSTVTSPASSSAPVGVLASSSSPPTPASSASGHALAKLALVNLQHGAVVHGTVQIPALDGGARLEVELLARRASLAGVKSSGRLRVGRLVRSAVPGGKVSFAIPLTVKARRALRRHGHLALTVKIVLTPRYGMAVILARDVVLR